MNIDQIEEIAEKCHEVNRVYCWTLGDTSQVSWSEAPEWQKRSAINGVLFHLFALKASRTLKPSASHKSWFQEKLRDGWVYGPVKDPQKKQHPCLVPYDQLPVSQKLKDYIFTAIVQAYWDASGEELL